LSKAAAEEKLQQREAELEAIRRREAALRLSISFLGDEVKSTQVAHHSRVSQLTSLAEVL
jgi:hypothetical protein